MRKLFWPVVLLLALVACKPQDQAHVTLRADGRTYSLSTSERVPSKLLAQLDLTLGKDDRLLYLGASTPADAALPEAANLFLDVRRAGTLTLVTPEGSRTLQTSAATVGQALTEAGIALYAADQLDPPAETPLTFPLTVTFTPARPLTVRLGADSFSIRSAAGTVGQALAESGLPLQGLDYSQPAESDPLPLDGHVRIVHVVETVALAEKAIPFNSRTELTAELELDQQSLLQGGQAGLAVTRTRVRSEDGVQVSTQSEGETVVRPPEDRVIGYGTKIVIRTTTVDGQTITYWRALRLFSTSYSPCRSASPNGNCLYGTSSGLPVKRGVVAMVYYWYLLFGGQPIYVEGYGNAVVADVGGGCPPAAAAEGCPAKSHYWIDLGWSDSDYQSMIGWRMVYFLLPVQEPNPGYILP